MKANWSVKLLLLIQLFPVIYAGSSCAVSDSAKSDCGYYGIDESGCLSKGCCWQASYTNSVTPWCFYPSSSNDGYSLSGMTETSTGYSGTLSLIGDGSTVYGADIKNLNVVVTFETEDILRIKITDSTSQRWEVPQSIIPRTSATSKPAATAYTFSYTESPFTFEVIRKSDSVSVFKTAQPFVYKDQYIELATAFDSNSKTFGLAESARTTQALKQDTYTLWAADIAALSKDVNLYGSFPYYLQMLNGKAHGALLMNSNGIDAVLGSNTLTFKAIGGIIDLYVFTGSSPANVVEQYTSVVGRPSMMPYWSLGYHNCKYGYTSLSQIQDVVTKYAAAGIPLDTQWADIDYMQNYRDFTTDAVNFPAAQMKSFVEGLHSAGQHFVPIIDPGIMVMPGYDAYDTGLKQDLFVKDISGGYYLGQVWPGPTYFPDFFHPSAQSYWTDQIQNFYDMVPVDGLWIDMNEVSNFCNGDGTGQVCVNTASSGCPAPGASQTDCCLSCKTVDSSNKLDFPPYSIGNLYGRLSTKTMAMSATHYNNVTVYDAHNLYGLTEQMATNAALKSVTGKRPFLLTRSSFPSSGVHTAKWTGDNGATWDDLKASIVGIMDFNIMGVPMIGADICGFIFDTTEELCARWIEVGAFYPFSRNHNTLGAAPQELYLWDTVSTAAKNALAMRYQLLPYLYTLFYQSNALGATVARPLWMNFPEDTTALSIDRQFMLGDAVLVSPVVDQGVTSLSAYFPQGYWYNFNTRSLAIDASTGGTHVTLATPMTATNVHMLGGNILPLQDSAMTTTAGRKTPFTLLAALSPKGLADGALFWDDGEQIELTSYFKSAYSTITTSLGGAFTGTVSHNSYSDSVNFTVGTVVIMGTASLVKAPTAASLGDVELTSSQIEFNAQTNVITFKNLNIVLSSDINIQWKY